MLRSLTSALAVLILACASLPAMLGCSEAERAKMEYRSKRAAKVTQEGLLRERARDYWDAVRWENWGDGSKFLEKSDAQLSYLRSRTRSEERRPTQIDAFELKYVFVDTETRNSGEVRVTWTEFQPPANVAHKMTASQKWYRSSGMWFVAPDGVLDTHSEAVEPALSDEQDAAQEQDEGDGVIPRDE